VLLGQRNAKQVDAAATAGEALSPDEAAWVRRVYRAPLPLDHA
jgi:acyl-coenzyme A synthetase/AMP-(fatty) acid ligase